MDSSQHPSHGASPPVATRQLEILDEERCRELLQSATVGRLAVSTAFGPEIFPVNFVVVHNALVFATDPGVKLDHSSFARVALETDCLDPVTRTGWVVVAKGHAEDISDGADILSTRLREVEIDSWVQAPHRHRVAIMHPSVSGRRLVAGR